MKAKKCVILALIGVVLCGAGIWTASASNYEKGHRVLVGLKGVKVLVAFESQEAETYGLTKDMIQTKIELQLRRNGIKILTQDEYAKEKGSPTLIVTVTMIIRKFLGEEAYATYTLNIAHNEFVQLIRDPTIFSYSPTWEIRHLYSTRVGNLYDGFYATLEDALDFFINDYLAANPKIEGSKNNK